MDINCLKEEIVKKIVEYFNKKGICYNEDDTSFNKILQLWLENCDKRIPIKPHKVLFSKELQNKIYANELNDDIKELIYKFKDKFEAGENINPYLSRNTLTNNVDYLLNLWRIHHLHLIDDNVENKQLSSRSGEYLLFINDIDTVYFLDQTKHLKKEEFASKKFLEILKNNNWLGLVNISPAKDIISLSCEFNSDEEIYNLWKSNINLVAFKIGNDFYQTTNATTRASTNLKVQQEVMKLNKKLQQLSGRKDLSYSITEIDEDKMEFNIFIYKENTTMCEINIQGE